MKFIYLIIALIFISCSSGQKDEKKRETASYDGSLSKKQMLILDEIKYLEDKFSRAYPSVFKKEGYTIKFTQHLKLKQCMATLETYVPEGLVYRDKFDLIEKPVRKKILKYKGSHAITFGTLFYTKGRTRLYFNKEEDRNKIVGPLQRLAKLCKDKHIASRMTLYRKVRNWGRSHLSTPFEGSIPYRRDGNGGRVWTEDSGNLISVLESEKSFLERYRSLKNAKKSIYIQMLMFRGDEVGKWFAQELIKKKEQGLDVKVVVDGIFSHSWDSPGNRTEAKNTLINFENMMAAGIPLFGYTCGNRKNVSNAQFGIDIFRPWRANHEKIWIVDGELPPHSPSQVAITGGVNITDEYFAIFGPNKESWRDQDLGLKGPLVKELYDTFLVNFKFKVHREKNWKYQNKCLNPYNPITQKAQYKKWKKEKTKPYKKFKKKEEQKIADMALENIPHFKKGILPEPNLTGEKKLEIKYHKPKGLRWIHMRPDEGESYILPAYINMIKKAKREILITNAYMILNTGLRNALVNASNRGIKVKLLTNSLESQDLPAHTFVGRTYYKEIIERSKDEGEPIEIFEWYGKLPGMVDPIRGTIHAKYMVVDGNYGLVGSYNLTASSERNAETALAFESKEVGQELQSLFYTDLNYSKLITQEMAEEYLSPPKILDKIQLKVYKLIENFL